jgi:Tol biopolymer transport system component/L-ascorbate metabolism protein UlaG (beta-lactamase superfamily)
MMQPDPKAIMQTMQTMKRIIIFLLLSFIVVSSYAQPGRVGVTYVGNAGFMISIGDKKILIDALFKGFEGSYQLPQEVQNKLRLAQAPFDDVDLIIVTHAHGDHIDPDMVRQHMQNNPGAIFASTRQLVDALNAVDTLDVFKARRISFDPLKGESEVKNIRGIKIETFNLPHGTDARIINIGFLISVNGITLFQTGDADFDQYSFDEFRSFKLPEREIDLAFIQHYYLDGDSLSTKFVMEGIGGDYILPIHYHFTTPPFDSAIVRENYPDAVIFNKEMESWSMPGKLPISTGYLFNQSEPGDSAVVFAPGIFSLTNRLESNIAFSPDGRECFFCVIEIGDNKVSYKIYSTRYIDGKWTEPAEPFFVNDNVVDPFLSADGKSIYFSKNGDIWRANRTENGWSEPEPLPSPINSDSRDAYYTETTSGEIYFSSKRPGGYGNTDNWRVSYIAGQPPQAENLGPVLNTNYLDYSPFIAPDGSYLIFGSYRAGRDGLLYISFNRGNNQWTTPVDMNSCGAKVNNTTAHHSNPSLSPDGKYLFFRRHEADTVMDVYWVSADIIKDLKKKALQESRSQEFTDLSGDYLGQTPPGETPVVFAPGLISVDSTIEHGAPVFSPDGNTILWQSNLRHKEKETEIFLKMMCRAEGKWTAPEISPYGGMPAFSPDGKQIYFISSDTDKEKGLYVVEKQGEVWSEPKSLNLIARFPELKYLYGPSVTNSGNLYFFGHAEGLGSLNNFGIYRSEFINGEYAKPELLPPGINAGDSVLNWTPFIAPDESFLLFSSSRFTPDTDFGDIYVCFRRADGSWTEAINLGTSINSGRQERFPSISPDGKYLFFTRWITYGNEDVMWVSAKIIDDLKKEVLKPINQKK